MDEVNTLFLEIAKLKDNYAKTITSIEETQKEIEEKKAALEATRQRIVLENSIISEMVTQTALMEEKAKHQEVLVTVLKSQSETCQTEANRLKVRVGEIESSVELFVSKMKKFHEKMKDPNWGQRKQIKMLQQQQKTQ